MRQTLPVHLIEQTLAVARGDAAPRSLGWELGVLELPRALERGLPVAEAERLVAHDPERRWVLQVVRLVRGTGADAGLKSGDLVLRVEGRSVTRFPELEAAIAGRDEVLLTVVRDGQILEIPTATEPLDPTDVDRIVLWAGLRIHTPHRGARLQRAHPHRPYISWMSGGSPAGRAKIYAQRSVLSVNGVDTPDLDAFAAVVADLDPTAPVRLLLEDLDEERQVVTLELQPRFWPTEELVFDAGRWTRRPVGSAQASVDVP